MAFTAMSAQAVNTTLESGAAITTLLPLRGVEDVHGWTIDSEAIGGINIKIHCLNLEVANANAHPGATATAELKYTTCETLLNNAASMTCLPKEPIVTIVKFTGYLHGGNELTLVSPANGTLKFTEIKMDKEPGCSIGPNFEITGHAIFKDCSNEFLVDKVKHLIEQVQGTALNLVGHENSMKFGSKSLTFLGSEWIEMVTGNTWAFHT
jgi:hypothetical protein